MLLDKKEKSTEFSRIAAIFMIGTVVVVVSKEASSATDETSNIGHRVTGIALITEWFPTGKSRRGFIYTREKGIEMKDKKKTANKSMGL